MGLFGKGAMEKSACWGGSTHRCLLVFTSALLLCEIVVGRLCNSLINTVDSFHTLYTLIHLSLHPLEMLTGAPVTSFANPYTSPDPDGSLAVPAVDGPTVTQDQNPLPSQPDHGATGTAVSEEDQYSTLRIKPFGAVVSALLLGSLCVSITLEIITHTLQPHVIKRPLLATVVGAASLLFNSLILIWRRGGGTDLGVDGLSKATQNETFAASDEKAEADGQLEASTTADVNETGHHNHSTTEGSLHGGVLTSCNPGAPSVLDPDQSSRECCSSALSNSDPSSSPTTHSPPQSSPTENISHDCQEPQQTLQPIDHLSGVANNSACIGSTGWHDQVSSRSTGQKGGCMRGIKAGVRCLLGSVLVVTNGLVLLQFGADCLQPRWACRLLPYLDPVFSMTTVLVLIATALPELQRHALMLLQAAPAHLRVEELIASIGRVPGVLAIHELHVWQLSETRLVASVHVHCPSGLGALQCSELLVMVTEVLKCFGVSHCTVQPEFITVCSNDPLVQGSAVPVPVPATEGAAVQPYCSLRCGKECAKKMCCSPPEEPPCHKTLSTVDVEVRHQDIEDIVIENTYL